jgi:hypothetical protein
VIGDVEQGTIMKPSKAVGSVLIGLVTAVALVLTGCASSEAGKRYGTKHGTVEVPPPPKPAKLRYYGGPKSPMYPG